MMMSHTVGAWEPMKHVSWIDESVWPGPWTSLVCDYYLSTENGKTRIRLVQSAFGPSGAAATCASTARGVCVPVNGVVVTVHM